MFTDFNYALGILLIDHDVDFCIIGHFLRNCVPQL